MSIVESVKREKIVAVIRTDDSKEAYNIAKAAYEGGIKTIEFTFSIPNVCDVIEKFTLNFPDSLVGAGTVLTKKNTIDAIKAGAKYIVSPGYVDEVQSICDELKIDYLPGSMTITEILNATNKGNKIVKLFPGSEVSKTYLKAIKSPLPDVCIMVTGGVDLENINEWFENGADIVGIGSAFNKEIKGEDYSNITKLAEKYLEKIC